MAERLTDEERIAISAVVHQNYCMPDVFAVVEQIITDRLRGETVIEWNTRHPSLGLTHGHHGTTEGSARITAERSNPPRTLVRHERTRYPDRVTDWEEVS